MFSKSIRWQIQAWHGSLLTVITISLLAAFYRYEWRQRIENLDNELERDLVIMIPGVDNTLRAGHGAPQPPGSLRDDERLQHDAAVLEEISRSSVYYVVFSPRGRELMR